MNPPILEVIAGPNGSGKTTFAEALYANQEGFFINPDLIAAGLAPSKNRSEPNEASFHAGRIMIETVRTLLASKQSFAFESTLSGRTWLSVFQTAVESGYFIRVYFLFLKSGNTNIKRIRDRVLSGGHHVNTVDVRRRIPRSKSNFWNLYRPLCNDWTVLDNSGTRPKAMMTRDRYVSIAENQKADFLKLFLNGSAHEPS